MKKRPKPATASQETATEIQAETALQGVASGIGAKQLIANYEAILAAKAIYYPLAYRFLRELGRGRQGIVFLALRHGARGCITRHAVKVFDPGIYPNARKYWTDMGRIADQTSRLQPIRSPNLVSRDNYNETSGIGYLEMECIEGMDLQEFIRGDHILAAKKRTSAQEWSRLSDTLFRFKPDARIKIQPGIALYMMRQVLQGLEYLHKMGFLHSDIKPSNIMVDRLGFVKLVDYGRATRINEKLSFLLGSPHYMAPEIHRRENGSIQSDLYSVGLVGLELLRGEPLFQQRGLKEAEMLEVKMSLPQKLNTLLPDYILQNSQFVQVLHRFLDPDPLKRFPSAMDADSGKEGLQLLHKQLTLMGKDTEYGRELQSYLSKLPKIRDEYEEQD